MGSAWLTPAAVSALHGEGSGCYILPPDSLSFSDRVKNLSAVFVFQSSEGTAILMMRYEDYLFKFDRYSALSHNGLITGYPKDFPIHHCTAIPEDLQHCKKLDF
jgi:hypothetical protein